MVISACGGLIDPIFGSITIRNRQATWGAINNLKPHPDKRISACGVGGATKTNTLTSVSLLVEFRLTSSLDQSLSETSRRVGFVCDIGVGEATKTITLTGVSACGVPIDPIFGSITIRNKQARCFLATLSRYCFNFF
eukprot:scaffold13631_cov38-Cyclotella_meneghiniana.AAC.12